MEEAAKAGLERLVRDAARLYGASRLRAELARPSAEEAAEEAAEEEAEEAAEASTEEAPEDAEEAEADFDA
jgi:hypothetical protein